MARLLVVASIVVGLASSLQAARPSHPWAIAIHGGVSSHVAGMAPPERGQYLRAMAQVLFKGRRLLRSNWHALDVVEKVVRELEDSPLFNAGRGAVCTYDGHHELDASIMDGRQGACGAVSAVKLVRNPISLARKVMEKSKHVFLTGSGAEDFAYAQGESMVANEYFATAARRAAWKRTVEGRAGKDDEGSTVGCVVVDCYGNLAAATSTGGLTAKRWGRVGDSPIIGAGTWAANESCAVSCTGRGEDFIRHAVAHTVAAAMVFGGKGLDEAAEHVLRDRLPANRGGLIAVDHEGNVLALANTKTMLFAVANSRGVSRWGFEPQRVVGRVE